MTEHTERTAHSITVATPNGPFTAIHDAGTVLASGWTDDAAYLSALINPRIRPATVERADDDAPGRRIADAVTAYYDGELGAVDEIAVEQVGGPFVAQAWKVLRGVPAGQTRTYTEFAELAGNAQAIRAAAQACATNAAALFVPCHRIQRSDGTLGGFRYGLDIKSWLLDHEAADLKG
ncbi:putative methylated-DNA--protein-cysteine methyltransferase [Gordonia araii NBRC 100433]|uniref:Putative methylated-DNA--protein-cysteine methyltransferase n=1 Tax=Gordonia araii NBRC 100433 TaxID=1073574 RepID=G7H1Q5_9ACTN|nr:methylated-DNA--[protein]-cysteine S-methyltransferase [Gordonia araii]NNG99228.1 methylated-DNA--[protein]-cysteine S-methyltransferase [Gordonia araii NBRC 100433]GAB09780.1 putative methylated-DNA--protein-cysteine methyltransferase [Gordonia araii NBRC 100433]